jgi:hypothetical protein
MKRSRAPIEKNIGDDSTETKRPKTNDEINSSTDSVQPKLKSAIISNEVILKNDKSYYFLSSLYNCSNALLMLFFGISRQVLYESVSL